MIKYTKIMIQVSKAHKLLKYDIFFHVSGSHVIKIKPVMSFWSLII